MNTRALIAASVLALMIGGAAVAQQSPSLLTSVPQNAAPITNYYKQNVYDPSDNKIGEITDLIVQNDGKIAAAMVGVGGFLGMGEKEVAVPFEALHATTKNNKTYLVMSTSKDALKSAPGFKYDRSAGRWVAENAN
jgi:sporulation protein YlmC with PRC-barrel domain